MGYLNGEEEGFYTLCACHGQPQRYTGLPSAASPRHRETLTGRADDLLARLVSALPSFARALQDLQWCWA